MGGVWTWHEYTEVHGYIFRGIVNPSAASNHTNNVVPVAQL